MSNSKLRDSKNTLCLLLAAALCAILVRLHWADSTKEQNERTLEILVPGFSTAGKGSTKPKSNAAPEIITPAKEDAKIENSVPQTAATPDNPTTIPGYTLAAKSLTDKGKVLLPVVLTTALTASINTKVIKRDLANGSKKLYLSIEPVDLKDESALPVREVIELPSSADFQPLELELPLTPSTEEQHLGLWICSDIDPAGRCSNKPTWGSAQATPDTGTLYYFEYLLRRDHFYLMDQTSDDTKQQSLKQQLRLSTVIPQDMQIRIFKRVVYYQMKLKNEPLQSKHGVIAVPWLPRK